MVNNTESAAPSPSSIPDPGLTNAVETWVLVRCTSEVHVPKLHFFSIRLSSDQIQGAIKHQPSESIAIAVIHKL
jgi:hypothetical protein